MNFKLNIKGLFGNLNYNINFNRPIHFLIGPNGVGKTTILKILSNLSKQNICFFEQLPFEKIIFEEEGNAVELDKKHLKFNSKPSFNIKFIDEFRIPDWIYSREDDLDRILKIFSNKLKGMDKNDLRMEFLFELFRERFLDKQISFLSGINFTNLIGNDISLNHLSDGEKRILVYWFSALFETEPNSLLMIDNPETSLHVEWQYEFINDLKKIQNIHPIDVLISTHSPQIINGDWDSVIDLFECSSKKGDKK